MKKLITVLPVFSRDSGYDSFGLKWKQREVRLSPNTHASEEKVELVLRLLSSFLDA
jgi:hypothetical protein